ncbi:hypothetical protein T484DRAFT_3003666 [Baffinella frigidus]|nr:hypothetical protein T484DRAFT_3003666 [Cryptophyta sp. CCMP2293]
MVEEGNEDVDEDEDTSPGNSPVSPRFASSDLATVVNPAKKGIGQGLLRTGTGIDAEGASTEDEIVEEPAVPGPPVKVELTDAELVAAARDPEAFEQLQDYERAAAMRAITEEDVRDRAALTATRKLMREEILGRIAEADAAVIADEIRRRAGGDAADRLAHHEHAESQVEGAREVAEREEELAEEERLLEQRPEFVHAARIRREIGGAAGVAYGGLREMRNVHAIMSDGEDSEITSGATTPPVNQAASRSQLARQDWEGTRTLNP